MSGDVLRYVGASRSSATKHMGLFHQPARSLVLGRATGLSFSGSTMDTPYLMTALSRLSLSITSCQIILQTFDSERSEPSVGQTDNRHIIRLISTTIGGATAA
jgi:hypothetical protein